MTITLRLDKGSELTFQELDNNFTDLNSRLNVLETTDTDKQTLTLNGTTLSISNGNSVDLGSVSASVSIGDSAPITPEAGDLWWQSDVGRLRIYYTDTGGSQWVDASPTGAGGGGSNVTVSDDAPGTPVQGDLWWESDVGKLRIYYNNVWVDAAPSGTGGSAGGDLSISSISELSDVDFNSITLDGSNGQNKVLAWDEALQSFVPRSTAVVTVSDVPPATPVEGDLWWESDVGKLRIYYNDGVQSQWVDANPAGTGVDLDDLNVVTSRGSTTTNTITVGGITSTGTISSDTSLRTQGNIEFEGSTNNAFETRLQVVDPTQDNTITFQNASGTVAFLSDIVGGGGSSYTDSDVDTHLNTGTATANQVLSWDGADYAWVADQTGSGGLANIVEDTTPQLGGNLELNGNNITGTGNIDITNTNIGNFEIKTGTLGVSDAWVIGIDEANTEASSLVTFNVDGNSIWSATGTALTVNPATTFNGTVNILGGNNLTVGTVGGEIIQVDGTGVLFSGTTFDANTTTLTVTDPTAVRTITLPDASGTIALTSDITSYSDADVDTHLNTSTATANQILSWDGADYAWVADQTGAGSTYGDTDVATYLNGNLDSHIIPDTNATYDIGSAEYKIRHLYLSSTSMYMGDNDVPIQLSADEKSLAINSVPLKVSTAINDLVAGPIDITITNHFIQNGNTYTLLDSGTYVGQELKFWKVGDGPVATYADITVGTANVTDAAGIPNIELGFTWRLGDANVGMYSCIWDGNAWVLSSGQAAV